MKRIQINHDVVDQESLKEIKGHFIAPWQKYMLFITGVIALGASIINFMNKSYPFGVVLVILAVVCFFEIYWLDNKKYKDIIRIMREETEKEENIYTMVFGNDALTIRNCDMATDNKMPYDKMKKLKETTSSYVLFGKKNQFAIIKKESLKVSPKELIDFLQSKETHIKKWPKIM